MNSVIICFVGLYFAIMVNSVFGRCEEYAARHGVMNTPFYFAFLSSSRFNILMQLKNVSPKITAIMVTFDTDVPESKSKYEWDRDAGDHFRICGELTYNINVVNIGLELYSSNGLCATKLVSEGRHARILQHGVADSTYESDHSCLNFPRSSCAIEIDLRNYCIESKAVPNAKRKKTFVAPKPTHHYSNTTRNTTNTTTRRIFVTPKLTLNITDTTRKTSNPPTISNIPKATQNISHTMRNTSIIPKPTIPATPKSPQNIPHITRNTSVTPKPTISDTRYATQNVSNTSKSTRNISNTSNATWVVWDTFINTIFNLSNNSNATWYTSDTPTAIQNMSDTSNATVIGTNDAVVIKYTITTALAVFGIALILVVFVAIRKRWWMKRNPSGAPEVLSNDQTSPFYVNLLFRRQCEQEIELIDQHHYEEINPQ